MPTAKKILTPWYPGGITPLRKGVYQRRIVLSFIGATLRYAYWDGKRWHCYAASPKGAQENKGYISVYQTGRQHRWRGLVQPLDKLPNHIGPQ